MTESHRRRVDDDALWERLRRCESLGSLEALMSFGSMLVNELQARTDALDAKATNLLAWNAAASAALMTAWWRLPELTGMKALLFAGMTASTLGTLFAYLALRAREFEVPSQAEWLQLEFLEAPAKDLDEAARTKKEADDEQAIRRRHIACLLRWHRGDSEQNAIKARRARWAFTCLFIAGMALPLALLGSALPNLP